MPKIATKSFQNGKVYKLVSAASDAVYVGSSTQPRLSQHLAQHRADHANCLAGKRHYMSSFDLIQKGECEIVLLEN
jgi:hypothetical protein